MIAVSLETLPHGEQSRHARTLLAECLQSAGVAYIDGATPLRFGEHGKPSLAEFPDVHFNLSHANGVTACIVTDGECGIDCECVRPCRMRVAKKVFSDEEQAALEAVGESGRDMLFFRIWTLKEAFVKALGIGISYPMNTVTFTLTDSTVRSTAERFYFSQYIINDSAIVSVCEKTEMPQTVKRIRTDDKRLILRE